jgi:hypothetical protein
LSQTRLSHADLKERYLMKHSTKLKSAAAILTPLALVIALAGCSGNGAGAYDGTLPSAAAPGSGAGTASSSGAPVSTVSKVTLFGDSTTLSTAKDKPINLSAIVTSPDNVAITGKNVTFAVADPSANSGSSLTIVNATTDKAGLATATLNLLNDLTERDIKVTARYADATPAEFVVRVAGNVLTASGPAQLPLNGTASTYTVQLKDSSGKAIANQAFTVTSKAGNTLSATGGKTDAGGQASFTVKGTVAGADTITATALGVIATRDLSVSGDSLSVASSGDLIPIGSDATITVSYQSSTAIPAGTNATLTTTAGTVRAVGAPISAGAASASAPISGGTATFALRSTSASPATVSALIGKTVATTTVNFVSVTPATISVQPSPAILGPNLGNESSQRSQLVAIVRDASGNPVANRTVTFNATDNPSGGRIEPSLAITDFSGTATVSYIAGPNTSPPNGVKIVASLSDPALSSSPSPLSVSQQSLFLRMGTDNLVRPQNDKLVYEKWYSVLVTDSTGNAAKNAVVQAKLTPQRYRTGSWVLFSLPGSTAPAGWTQNVTGTLDSEDRDNDGQCIAGEDSNTDGSLTPGNVASVSTDVVTDGTGIAVVKVTYPKNFAMWTELALEVTAKVGGSEGRSSTVLWLPILADDIKDPTIPPPGRESPFPYANPRPGSKCGT